MFAGALVLSVVSPVIHVILAVMDIVFDRRRWRFTRLGGLGLAFCVVETFGLFAAFTTWLGSGFGRFIHRPFWARAHTVLMGQWLELITRALRFYLGFTFELEAPELPDGPRLVLSRHAGPGDALLLARIVVRDHGRRLHMIGANKLLWDPFLDVMGERIGFHYLGGPGVDRRADLDAIRNLANGLESDETLVIFPEGGNFTPSRREASFQHFERRGRHELLLRGVVLRHILPPRSGAVEAALSGAPDLTVVVVAHTGLEEIYGLRDLWHRTPLDRTCRANAWEVPYLLRVREVEPAHHWLWQQWLLVDRWIDRRRGAEHANTDRPD